MEKKEREEEEEEGKGGVGFKVDIHYSNCQQL